jgi:hypothetical protein
MTLLQPEVERIFVFVDQRRFIDRTHGGPATIKYCQFTYTGDCIFESDMTLNDLDAGWLHAHQLQMTLVDRRGIFRFSMVGDSETISAQFDEQQNTLTNLRHTTDESCMWTDVSRFWWKDTFFRAMEAPNIPHSSRHAIITHGGTRYASGFCLQSLLSTSQPFRTGTQMLRRCSLTSTSDEPHEKPLVTRVSGSYNDYNVTGSLQSIVLNDKYVVRALANTFYVLCYDDSLQLPKESGPFFDIGSLEIKDPLEIG